MGQSNFFHLWPQKLYRVFPHWFLLQLGNFWPWWSKILRRGNHWTSLVPCLWRVFQTFLSKCFEVSTSTLLYTFSLHNILSSRFTRMGSLDVLSLGTVNLQDIYWCWQTGVLGSLRLLLFDFYGYNILGWPPTQNLICAWQHVLPTSTECWYEAVWGSPTSLPPTRPPLQIHWPPNK